MGEYAFLAVYRNSYGMAFTNLRDAGNGMTTAWLILGVEWVVFMTLAWYLEQVGACAWLHDVCAAADLFEQNLGMCAWFAACCEMIIRLLSHGGSRKKKVLA
jgi:hypothetical protein